MARGKKTGGRDYAPGHSAPGPGRPPLPPELKELKRLTKGQFELLATNYLNMPDAERLAAIASPDTPGMQKWLATCVETGIETGDFSKLNQMLDRLIGKPKDELEVTAKPFIVKRSDGSEVVLGTKKPEEE